MNTLQFDTALGQPEWTDNWTIGGCGSLHMEIMNAASGDVWLAQQPVTDVQFEALVPPPGFQKSGIGQASVDAAYFRRSPGASADGPVETMEVDGLRFARVARPVRFEPGHRGLWVAYIDKYHRVVFKAGRGLRVFRVCPYSRAHLSAWKVRLGFDIQLARESGDAVLFDFPIFWRPRDLAKHGTRRIFHEPYGVPELFNLTHHQTGDFSRVQQPPAGRLDHGSHLQCISRISGPATDILTIFVTRPLLELEEIDHHERSVLGS